MDDFKSFESFQESLHHPEETEEFSPDAEEEERGEAEDEAPRGHRTGNLRKWRNRALCCAGAAAFIALCIRFLPIGFGEIRLTGNETVTMEDILFDGAVGSPVNVWQVNTTELEGRLSRDIRVGKAEVTRSFPFYINVAIEERKPVAAVQEEFGYALLDKSGMVISTVSYLRGVDLPMITGIKLDNVLLGDVVNREQVRSALEFFVSLSPDGLKSFSEVNVGNKDNVVAYTRDGVPVWLGRGDRMNERAALVEKMLKDMRTRNLQVEHVDASLTSPFFKMKE